MTLWEKFRSIGLLQTDFQKECAGEAARFKSDQAFKLYMDQARFNIATQLLALEPDEVEKFKDLKRCQQALDGFSAFIDTAILDEKMRNRQ